MPRLLTKDTFLCDVIIDNKRYKREYVKQVFERVHTRDIDASGEKITKAEDNGKVIFINLATALSLDVETTKGIDVTLVNTADRSGAATINTVGSGNFVGGLDVNNAAVNLSKSTLVFGTAGVKGDYVRLIGDGTDLIILGGFAKAASGIS